MRAALLVLLLGAVQEQPARIVFLGDSITDGHTLPLLLRQALGAGAPACINAGVAGDTAAGMRAQLLELIRCRVVWLWKWMRCLRLSKVLKVSR